MTSKEALEIIKKYDDFVMARYLMKGILSPQTIGSPSKVEFDEAVKTIEKDLEMLETFKKHLVIDENNDVWLKIEKDNTGYVKVEGIQWGNWNNDK